jgi:hypothetical protein
MANFRLLPGDRIADADAPPETSDHRQVLRSFMNTIFWDAVGVAAVLAIMA